MIPEHESASALVILANFVSPLAVDLSEASVLRQWAEQAPRKLWLTRPGDVLIAPVPLTDAFRRYVFRRLGMPDGSVTIVTVPDTPDLPMAEALAVHGLLSRLRGLVRERPGARLLPTALDDASVALAADLGIPVVSYEKGGPGPRTVRAVADLNTKSGFRSVAARLGMRLPSGRTCSATDLLRVAEQLLTVHERVVIKPDRSAGGHGLHFVARGDRPPVSPRAAGGRWVVEEYVAHTNAVSAQGYAGPARITVLFDGEMRMAGGSFAGYRSPPAGLSEAARTELHDWTLSLGRHLVAEGYCGPYCLDAVCAEDGALHAVECNVRRTATTTVHAMITRLAHGVRPAPAWSMGTVRASSVLSFDTAVEHLAAAGLDFQPRDREGVILYADRPARGTGWRYAILAADHGRLTRLEAELAAAFGHDAVP